MLDRAKLLFKKVERHPELAWYTLLSLLILGPILLKGYVLTLDMVFTPKLPAPTDLTNTYLFDWAIHAANFILSGAVIQKLLIFTILFMGALGAHRLVRTKAEWPRYFAGVFYTVNPFTYERWMAGQYLIVFGFALLPWVAKALFDFLAGPRKRTALRLSLWYTVLAIVSVHMFALAVMLGLLSFFVYLVAQAPRGSYYSNLWKYGFGIIAAVLVLNSYWLYGLITGTSPISQTIDSFSGNDFQAFATAYNPHGGLFFNVLSMFGFWLEPSHRYAMPNTHLWLWFGGFALFLLLVILGFRQEKKRHALPAVCLGIAGFIGFIMACGVNAHVTGPVVHWILLHVPLMDGFREPEKFSALLVLAYVYFSASGLERLLGGKRIAKWPDGRRETLFNATLLLPLLYVSTMPLGFAKQLKPVQYPASWYSFNESLAGKQHGKVLFLPWHQYMSYDFAPRVIADPSTNFFYNATVIHGTDAEFGNIKSAAITTDSSYVESQILTNTNQTDLGESLAKIGVQYVLLTGGFDYQKYGWVSNQTDLKLISNKPSLSVYKNEAYRG